MSPTAAGLCSISIWWHCSSPTRQRSAAPAHSSARSDRHCGIFLAGDPGSCRTGRSILEPENIVIKVSDTGPRYEIWTQAGVEGDEVESNIWQQAEIEDGYAWVNGQTSEEFIPQMLNYHNIGGINFEKGCYLGQEIIARLEYRGKLKRKLHRGLSISPVAVGDAVVNKEGKEIGLVASVAEFDNAEAVAAGDVGRAAARFCRSNNGRVSSRLSLNRSTNRK